MHLSDKSVVLQFLLVRSGARSEKMIIYLIHVSRYAHSGKCCPRLTSTEQHNRSKHGTDQWINEYKHNPPQN